MNSPSATVIWRLSCSISLIGIDIYKDVSQTTLLDKYKNELLIIGTVLSVPYVHET